jgi:hypothetical protein
MSTFKQSIVCECGHAGFLHLTESGHWDQNEHYYLEGFGGAEVVFIGGNGGHTSITYGGATTTTYGRSPDMVSAVRPQCPECGRTSGFTVPATDGGPPYVRDATWATPPKSPPVAALPPGVPTLPTE